MGTYSLADAMNRLPSPIDRALAGEEVVIARHGKPVAELRQARAAIRPAAADGYLDASVRCRRHSDGVIR